MPAWRGASGSVRARRMPRSATRPLEHHTFWPVTTQSSPSRSARRAEAGQVAAGAGLGEELAPHLLGLEDPAAGGPPAAPGVPKARIEPPVSTSPTMLIHGGTSAMAHSVVHAAVCSTVSPRPPCSTGQWSPAQPGLEQRPLPGPALLGQVRRQDRAVVTGRLGLVGGQPGAGLVTELVHLHGGRWYAAPRSVE